MNETAFVFIVESPTRLVLHEVRGPDAKARFYALLKKGAR